MGRPAAEVDIDEALVRRLLTDQHPQYADRTLREVDAGWDNVMYRLGDDLAVRIPRRELAAELARNEHRWLPLIANRLAIAIPTPVHAGQPSDYYPWHWSIVPWLTGQTADVSPPSDDQAVPLAEFMLALHVETMGQAPPNPYRGVALSQRHDTVVNRIERMSSGPEPVPPELIELWHTARQAPPTRQNLWLHGDLHGRNVLVEDGVITGILDWGDVTGGDPATDLAGVWMLLNGQQSRKQCLATYGADETLILRARGWATFFAIMHLSAGLDDSPEHAAIGRSAMQRLLEDL